ncbi:DUF192 domain-containing protein [Haliangium sp.]|uniref:DUF192 domain-containing protein n=1 Tax=Haliangium sp. TaxID=2663208 RepID=UPI003D129854
MSAAPARVASVTLAVLAGLAGACSGPAPDSGPDAGIDAGPACPAAAPAPISIERGPGESGPGELVLAACAELAVTEAERRQGLRGHDPLGSGEALLIVLPDQLDDICVTNDGVSFAIDVVFAAGDGRVTAIEREFPADDGDPRCHDGVRWIVEFAAGAAAAVAVGDSLVDAVDPRGGDAARIPR